MASQIVPEYLEILYDSMVSLGGGVFRGVQPGFRDASGKIVEALVLFDSTDSPRVSIALPASKISAHAVIGAIREKRKQFQSRTFEQNVA
jgi:hypothetical protein